MAVDAEPDDVGRPTLTTSVNRRPSRLEMDSR